MSLVRAEGIIKKMDVKESDLWERYSRGDRPAFEGLILYYLPLAKFWARKISVQAPWTNVEDLEQEGVIGLINAIRNFDKSKSDNFRYYARYYIRGAIFDSSELTRSLKRSVDEKSRQIRKAHNMLMQELQRKPTSEEISTRCGLTINDIDSVVLTNEVVFAQGETDSDEDTDAPDDSVSQERLLIVEEALLSLPERERLILIDHYWFGLSLAETAIKYSLNNENAKKIHQRAIIKLRDLLESKSETNK